MLRYPDCTAVPLLGFEANPVANKDEEQTLERALQLGYRYISSNGLPESEQILGKVLRRGFEEGRIKREEIFISAKLPLLDPKPEDVELRIKQSLSNLRLDYVDLFLLEIPNTENVSERSYLWQKMETTITSSRAKHIGLSNVSIDDVNKILKTCCVKPSCVELEVQVDSQQHEMVDFCRRNGISKVARVALENPTLTVNAIIKKIARKHERTAAQIFLKYLMQNGFSVVPKHLKKSRLKEYANVHNFSLDEVDMRQLDALNIESCCRVYDCAALKRSVNTSDLQINV